MKEKIKYSNVGDWFRDTWLYRYVLSAVSHPKTFLFLRKYPFWKSYNVWTRRFTGWAYSLYDWIPSGWQKAFGKELTEDIVKALRADRIPKRKWTEALQFQDIKEKYGELRLYATTTERVAGVLGKYECLSIGYCQNCGKPARYITSGWISYLCEDCAKSAYAKFEDAYDRLTKDNIPTYFTYKNGEEIKYTPLERWGVDLEAIWGIKE